MNATRFVPEIIDNHGYPRWRKRFQIKGKMWTRTWSLQIPKGQVQKEVFQWFLELHEMGKTVPAGEVMTPPNPAKVSMDCKPRSLGQTVADYLAMMDMKVNLGKVGGVSHVMRSRTKTAMGHLLRVCGESTPFPKTTVELGILLREFRATRLQELSSGTIKPNTFNNINYDVSAFFKHLWKTDVIAVLPKDFSDNFRSAKVQCAPKNIPMDILRRIFVASSEELKTFILLGLNCGMGEMMIADLKNASLVGGRMVDERKKSGVNFNIPLWPETLEFIEKTRASSDAHDCLFQGRSGKSLGGGNAARTRSSRVRNLWVGACKKAGVSGYGFYDLRRTSATKVEGIDSLLTSKFLCHTEKEMKKHYVATDARKEKFDGMVMG